MVKGLLEDFVDRGLDLKRRYLVVIDGSKTLRASVERVCSETPPQRPSKSCRICSGSFGGFSLGSGRCAWANSA